MECLGAIVASVVAETCSGMCSRVMFKSNTKALKRALERLKNVYAEVNEVLKNLEIQERSLQQELAIWRRKVDDDISTGDSKLKRRSSWAIFLGDKNVTFLEEVKRLEEQGQDLIVKISIFRLSREREERVEREELERVEREERERVERLERERVEREERERVEKVERVLGPSFHPQITTNLMLEKIDDSLKKKDVQKIGIWGMGGVGKTTLVRTFNNELLKKTADQQFALVIWVTVSKEFDLRKVQMDIAKRLGIILTREKRKELGNTIHKKLAELRSFLLILDDVWKPIDLESLGIPLVSKKFKVVLTSRRLEVCQQMMTDENIKVGCLENQEAWELFCHNAGEVANSDDLKRIAKEVSRECGGLPLAIITIGRALRGKRQVEVWKHALNMLRRSAPSIDTEEKIFGTLKLSYNFLQDKMKGCFLSCALFPEDYSIKVSELVTQWVVEGFLDEQHQYGDLMNEGATMVESLKDSCLLEEGDSCDTVKMHDVVRDFAIWIMSPTGEGIHSVVMAGRGLEEIPQGKFVSSVRRVSLMANKLNRLPNRMAKCVIATVLLLQENSPLTEVPDGFLQAFPNLKILNLSGARIRTLPNSFSTLHNLRSLVMRNCKTLKDLPSLKFLVKLQFLDLHECGLRELPSGLEALISLRYLCLSNTYHLQSIQAGAILHLSSLEVLDMAGSAYSWGIKGKEKEGQATLEEVSSLHRLEVLALNVLDVVSFSYKFSSLIQRLQTFKFIFSPIRSVSPLGTSQRCLYISDINVLHASIEWLLVHVTLLRVNYCEGLNGMFKNLVTKSGSSFVALKSLSIHHCPDLEFVWGCHEAHLDLLPNLEELSLRSVSLESIGELNAFLGLRFQKLKLLQIYDCQQLRCLFSDEILSGSLPNLQEINVDFCKNLEPLFKISSVPVDSHTESLLPKLSVIKLNSLPQLRNICKDRVVLESLTHLEVNACGLLVNLPITPL